MSCHVLTLGGRLKAALSMTFPPWKLDKEPMENHDALDVVDLALVVDLMDPLEPTLDALIEENPKYIHTYRRLKILHYSP